MRPNISITLITPHVTIERYSELTGLSIDTINDMLADGRVLRHRLRKDKKREKVMINIAAMTVSMASGPRSLRAGSARTQSSGRWFARPLTFSRRQPTRALAPLGLVAITVPLLKKRTRQGANYRAAKNLQRCRTTKT